MAILVQYIIFIQILLYYKIITIKFFSETARVQSKKNIY